MSLCYVSCLRRCIGLQLPTTLLNSAGVIYQENLQVQISRFKKRVTWSSIVMFTLEVLEHQGQLHTSR